MALHPFKTEYAKTSRSKCKSCCEFIEQEKLRIGKTYRLDCADKNGISWYCADCFFKDDNFLFSSIPTDTFEIEHFEQLRWNDQQLIKEKMKLKIFDNHSRIKYANENSICIRCARDIWENEIVFIINRVFSILVCLNCFKRSAFKESLNTYEDIGGFLELTETDQNAVRELNLINTDDKRTMDIKHQNEKMYHLYDQLNKKMSNKDLLKLLEDNKHTMLTKGRYDMLERLADSITYGNFVCKYCESDEINYTFTKFGYKCNSAFCYTYEFASDTKKRKIQIETTCTGISQYDRSAIQVSNYLLDKNIQGLSSLEQEYKPCTPALNFYPPLYNMKFFIGIQPVRGEKELEDKITNYGGIVVYRIQKDTTAVISNESDVQENKEYINTAQENNVYVISEDFIDESFDVYCGANFIITSKVLTNWGVNPDSRKDLNSYLMPKVLTSTIKNRLDIEPMSGLEQSAHIYTESIGDSTNENIYAEVLTNTDVQRDSNSYYKLQLLESDKEPRRYAFFAMWGRIGTNIGRYQLQECSNVDEGKKLFKQKYKEKSGGDAFSGVFSTQEGRYNKASIVSKHEPIMIVGEAFENSSCLDSTVKELVKIIFNEDLVQKTFMEYNFNTETMPLGKLEKCVFRTGYELLEQIRKVLKEKEKNWSFKIGCLTNEFYKNIPQNFGTAQPQIINNFFTLQEKVAMLEELQNAQFIYNIIHSLDNKNIDNYYDQLQANIQIVDESSDEYKTIQKYLKSGHGRTHPFVLTLQNVFEVQRLAEDNICALHNHKLLWHGSPRVNFASIISKGLMIAPPEATFQGAMFGKGIYFADVATKSVGYVDIQTTDEDNRRLLLLCDVALGNMHEVTKSTNNLPAGKSSIKALGKIVPSSSVLDDSGIEIPNGELQEIDIQSDLQYNEYIVYNPDQIKIRYVVVVNVNYKRRYI